MHEKTSTINVRCRRTRGLLLITGVLLVQSANSQLASVGKDSFETGTIQSSIWNASDTDGCSATVQTGDAADGKHYMRSTLTAKPGGGNYRCEQNAKGLDGSTPLNEDRYYGISIRIPSETLNDVNAGDTLMQLHTQSTMPDPCHYSIIWESDNSLRWHPHSCGGIGGPDATLVNSVQKDVWYRVCVNANWSVNSSGRFRVWVNPTSENSATALNFNGQTMPDKYVMPGKLKIGLYKPKWRSIRPPSNMEAMSPREFHHDDVRAGVSFSESCGSGTTQPIPIPEPPISVAVE